MMRTMIFMILLSLMSLSMSCTKLPEASEGDLEMKVFQLGDTIPSSWGNVIAIVSEIDYAPYVQLWFEDDKGNIYFIRYNVQKNRFVKNYNVLQRR